MMYPANLGRRILRRRAIYGCLTADAQTAVRDYRGPWNRRLAVRRPCWIPNEPATPITVNLQHKRSSLRGSLTLPELAKLTRLY